MSSDKAPVTREAFEARWRAIRERSLREAGPSLAERLRALPRSDRQRIVESLTPVEAMRLLYDWAFWGRPKQLAPSWDWDVWLNWGGRGSGKNRAASEFVDEKVRTGQWRTFALIGPDYTHVAKFMIGGEQGREHNGSGLMDIARPWCRPNLVQSRLTLEYPNGAIGHITTAEQPEYRGPNLDGAWGDELGKWRYGERFVRNLELATRSIGRSGSRPQLVYTCNPARLGFLLEMIMDEGTHVTHSIQMENAANLATSYLRRSERKLRGTADGARELDGEPDFFGDESRRVFPMGPIEAHRVDASPPLERIAVAIDPGASTNDGSDPTGIVAAGVDARGHVYVLEDATEERPPKRRPEDWSDAGLDVVMRLGASEVVAETNKGGDMVLATVRAAIARRRNGGRRVRELELKGTYTKGDKATRASPVRVLYLAGEVHHVGRLAALEDEMTGWERGMPSPNRLDALVMLVGYLRPDILREDGPDPQATSIEDALRATREIQGSRRELDLSTPHAPAAEGWSYEGGGDFTT